MPKDKKVSMLKIMMIALAAVLLVLIPVRCYQYASGVIEPTTGFYSGSDWSIWLSYILLAVSAVAFLAIAIASRKEDILFDRKIRLDRARDSRVHVRSDADDRRCFAV